MIQFIINALLLLGSISMLLAAIGLVRFPDFFTRAHAGTKAASLGAGLILIAAVIPVSNSDIAVRVWLTIFFVFLTVPIAGHLLGRSAYLRGLKQWPGGNRDEWRDQGSKENSDS